MARWKEAASQERRDVYLMRDSDTGQFKIGFSKRAVWRAVQLSRELGSDIRLIARGKTRHYRSIEAELHRIFSGARHHDEWFDLSEADVADVKKALADPRRFYMENLA